MKLLTVGERPLPSSNDICADHLDFAIDVRKLRVQVDLAVEVLKRYEFDAIAFRGMSGALIAPEIALRLNKSLILVRKDGDNSHSTMRVEGDRTAKSYVIVDDFQCIGSTAEEIVKGVRRFTRCHAAFLGFLAVRGLNREELEYVELLSVKRYNFSEGKKASLEKINGKWRLTPEQYLIEYQKNCKAQQEEEQAHAHAEELQRLREQRGLSTVFLPPKSTEKSKKFWATASFAKVERISIAETMEWVNTGEVKDVPKEVVPQKRTVGKRNAMPRNLFGQPYGAGSLRTRNYKVQGI